MRFEIAPAPSLTLATLDTVAMLPPRWKAITESQFPWEREALEFVRERLPDYEPYRAWANFEFIADNGKIYEVDLLILTPKGFFLVEIKSRPGRLEGDSHTWTWTQEAAATPPRNQSRLQPCRGRV